MVKHKKPAVTPYEKPSVLSRIPDLWIVLAIVLVTAAIKVLFLRQINNSILFTDLSLDDKLYDSWAMEIAKGEILGKEAFYGLPLYPYFLGLVYRLFGHSILIARLFQAAFDTISCVFLYLIAKRVFNKTTGIVASIIFIFYGMSLYYDGFLCSTPMAIMLYLSILLTLLSIADKPALVKWVGLGLVIGLACLASASVLLLVPLIFIWAYITFKGKGPGNMIFKPISMLAAMLAVISIVTIRNFVVEKDIIPITSHGGIAFYVGNNPDSIGSFYLPHNMGRGVDSIKSHSRSIAEKAMGRSLKPSEISKYWFNKGLSFIKDRPSAYLMLTLRKAYLFWWVRDIPEQVPYKFVRAESSLLRLPLFSPVLIFPLSILGMILSCRRRHENKGVILLFMSVGAVFISTTLYYVNSRYRMMAEPVLILFAAYAALYFWKKMRSGSYLFAAAMAAGCTALFLIFNIDFATFSEEVTYNKIGISYAMNGSLTEAEESFKKAIKLNHSDPVSYYNLGTLYLQKKMYDDAKTALQKAVALNPEYSDAHNNLGTIYMLKGDREKAIYHFENSIRIKPRQDNIIKALKDLKE